MVLDLLYFINQQSLVLAKSSTYSYRHLRVGLTFANKDLNVAAIKNENQL